MSFRSYYKMAFQFIRFKNFSIWPEVVLGSGFMEGKLHENMSE